jgi:hypothetical protein
LLTLRSKGGEAMKNPKQNQKHETEFASELAADQNNNKKHKKNKKQKKNA